MKRISIILIVVVILLVMGVAILFNPAIWQEQIELILNKRILGDKEWTVSIGKIRGHLFTQVVGEEILFEHSNGSRILIPEIHSKINLISSMFGKISLARLIISDIVFNSTHDYQTRQGNKQFINLKFVRTPIQIDDLRMGGVLTVSLLDTTHTFILNLKGNIHPVRAGMDLVLNKLNVIYNDSLLALDVKNTKIRLKEQEINVKQVNGIVSNIPFRGDLFFSWDSVEKVTGHIFIDRYSVPEHFFEKIPLKPLFSSMSTEIQFESNLTDYNGNITITNDLGLDMQGSFSIRNNQDHLLVESLELKSDPAQINATGLIEYSGRISGSMQLSSFDLSRWLIEQEPTDLSGLVLVEGLLDNGRISDVSLTMEIQESRLYHDNLISISGSVDYHDSLLVFSDPLTLSIGSSSVVVKGSADLNVRVMDLMFDMRDADVFLINNFWSDSLETGTATGQMKVTGSFSAPSVNADLICRDIRYKDFDLEEVEVYTNVDNGFDISNGFANIKFGTGTWREYSLDNGTVELKFNPGELVIENIQVNSGENFLQLSGSIEEGNQIAIDRIQVMYEGHYLISPKPLSLTFDGKSIAIKPFILHIDDGIAEGYFRKDEYVEGRIKLSNIESELFSNLIKDDRLKISGIIFGEVGIRESEGKYDYSIDVSLKKGTVSGQKFDDLVISLFVRDDILHIEELTLLSGQKTGIQMAGVLPLKSKKDHPVNIDLSAQFTNLNMEVITRFIPDWFYLGGQVNGNYHLGGTTEKTTFDFDISVNDAVFDILPLGKVSGKGYYDGRIVHFTSFSSNKGREHFEGSAALPVDYNINSEKFGKVILDEPLQLDVRGHTTSLDFLSSYLVDVDSINGEFDLKLQLSGFWDKIIRDGWFTVKNADLYTTLLNDPVTQLNGRGTLVKNQLIIDQLMGVMTEPRRNNKKKNVSISGRLDMARFFEPGFNVRIKGKEVYFEALAEDIKGTVDLNVTVTGKDTVTIAGEVAILEVEMYKDFAVEYIGSVPQDEGRITVHYKLKFPIKGEFNLLNNQIDARLGGDVSITKIGDYPADFSGELYIKEGKFYYSSDIFTISEGHMVFEEKGFNPYLDISAYTTIDDHRIDIFFTGLMDNPNLRLFSEKIPSQSDILELIILGKRFEDQEISFSGFGNQAVAKLERWVDTQLDRKLMQISGLDQLGLVEDVSIEGAAGLLDPKNMDDFSIKAGVSDKVSLNYAYQRSFSLTNPNHLVGIEYKVNRYLSLVGHVDQKGQIHAKYRLRYSY